MDFFDLSNAVQPADGYFVLAGIKNGVVNQRAAEDQIAAAEAIEYLQAQGRDVYYGVAKYKTRNGRAKDNVKALKAFWLDIDCGEKKAAEGKGYVDQAVALDALGEFRKLTGLPRPLIVDSGGGLHIYWPLKEPVTRREWEPVADRLKELCIKHGLLADPSVFEVARILRVPGTLNYKFDPPREVQLLTLGSVIGFEELKGILGMPETPEEGLFPKTSTPRELTALGKALAASTTSRFVKIIKLAERGCLQINNCFQNAETLSEPRWVDALSVANACIDREKAIHRLSSDHPEYDYAKTDRKAAGMLHPHNCTTFEKNNPGGCTGCIHLGKIKNPIVLGHEVLEADEEDNFVSFIADDGEVEEHVVPVYPFPFFRGKSGGIWRHNEGDEEPDELVYPYDFYVVKRLKDTKQGEIALFKVHLPKDGVQEFVIPMYKLAEKAEFRKALSAQGILGNEKCYALLSYFVMEMLKELQNREKAEIMRQQFGWADRDSKFIAGDQELSADGTRYSPPSSVTGPLAKFIHPMGSLEKWKEVWALYGRPGLEAHAFAALSAFGAPLLRFLKQSGAAINLISPRSGTGKTTILHMTNSVWGHPKELCAKKNDTVNAKMQWLAIMCNLPFCCDEVTNMHPLEFSELLYGMSQGKGKERMTAGGNELRINETSWQTISLCTSNASFYEKLSSLKGSPDGEMMRMMEYEIKQTGVIDTDLGKDMFDHQLFDNYGHAGPIFIDYVLGHMEEVRGAALRLQRKLDAELRLTQRERFWSAVVAANLTAASICKSLELIDWDLKALYQWTCTMVANLRNDIEPPAMDVAQVIGDYINRHLQNILVVNETADARTNMQLMPQLEPKGELLMRYEPDTKLLYIAVKPFKDDCVKYQINYKDTVDELKDNKTLVDRYLKRLSKGMKVSSPGVQCLVLDTTVADFIDIESIIPEEADAGGGSDIRNKLEKVP